MRFPDFNDEWKETTLGEVAEILSSQRVFASEYKDHGIPFYRGKEISELRRGHTPSDLLYISKDLYNEYQFNYGVPQLGDILITAVGTLGNLWIVDDSLFYFKDGNIIWLKSPQLYPYFLYSSLEYHKKNLLALAIGSSQKALTIEGVRKLNIAYPTSSEQKKIADFLSLIDERITNLSETLRELKNQKAALLNQLFSQKLRFPDFTDDWKETTLGEIGKTYTGLSGKSSEDFGKGSPYITYKMVYDGVKINLCNTEYVYVSETEKQNQVRLGDILFTTSSETPEETGLCSVLLSSCDELYLNSFCFGYRLNEENLATSIFLGYALRSPIYRMKLSTLAQGSTRYNISKSEVMRMPISLPTLEEQKKIADFLSLVDERIEVEEQLLQQYEKQKRYLLKQMFV